MENTAVIERNGSLVKCQMCDESGWVEKAPVAGLHWSRRQPVLVRCDCHDYSDFRDQGVPMGFVALPMTVDLHERFEEAGQLSMILSGRPISR